jgi:LuxR family transcriptional regulator, maltose regulon positive regulatory protein
LRRNAKNGCRRFRTGKVHWPPLLSNMPPPTWFDVRGFARKTCVRKVREVQELIPTKVAPPIWLGNQIRRDPLLDRLDGAIHRRLTLIHAPAGYGKTSLLSQWRKRVDNGSLLVAWLTLERDDADMKRLAQYLMLALNAATDGEDDNGAAMPPRAALSAIINRIAREPRQVVLILDDLHRAESPLFLEFLTSLIRLAPENCHFIISSRDYPSLGQSILTAEEQLLELTAEDLKFSRPEAEALLAQPLSCGQVGSIMERTEGWPIALQLTSLSLKRGIDHHALMERFSGTGSELARYLSEQVLMTLPDEIQDIILRTSILDQLTGDVVNLLCDREDGWLILERLEQQGVFLSALSSNRQAYRYHQLFAEYLRERLVRRNSAQYRALHYRAAKWFAERGPVATAAEHAIQAADDLLLATLLEDAGGWRLIPQGEQPIVERGLAKLPAAMIAVRPRLMLARVYLAIKHGEMGAARDAYDRFVAAAAEAEISADIWTEIRVVGDTLADYENAPVSLDDLIAREALLRTLPADDHLVIANISETLGASYFEGGWLERALEPTLAARAHYQALGSLYSDIFTRFLEARIRQAQGRFKEAAAILTSTRIHIEEHFGARSDLAANCAAFEAEILYEQGSPNALETLDWAVAHMEQSDGWVDVYAAAYLTAARAEAAEGKFDESRMTIARARRLADRRRLRQLDLLARLCELELVVLYGEDLGIARNLAREIGLDALADEMDADSPVYRSVAVAAALNRTKLALLGGEYAEALTELRRLKRWASQHGAGRLLIDINILMASALRQSGDIALSRLSFDEAVGAAMFQSILSPFIAARRFVEPCLEDALSSGARMDRFRAQFLKSMARSMARRPTAAHVPHLLNDAEAEILKHLSFGYSNKEIARLIGMSPDTVKYRLKSIFRKIGVAKRRDAVRVSGELGLLVE